MQVCLECILDYELTKDNCFQLQSHMPSIVSEPTVYLRKNRALVEPLEVLKSQAYSLGLIFSGCINIDLGMTLLEHALDNIACYLESLPLGNLLNYPRYEMFMGSGAMPFP